MAIGIGGALGAMARYGIAVIGKNWYVFQFPIATTLCNCIGCFVLGILVHLLAKSTNEVLGLFLITGFCGGFTTFSAFALEQKNLWGQQLFSEALLHLLLNNFLGIIFVVLGYYLSSKLFL